MVAPGPRPFFLSNQQNKHSTIQMTTYKVEATVKGDRSLQQQELVTNFKESGIKVSFFVIVVQEK